MKRLLTSLLLALAAMFAVHAQDPFGEHRYSGFRLAPTDENSTVFVGNSITNMQEWGEALQCGDVKGRGVSSTISERILHHVENLVAGKPKRIFLLVGTNDLAPVYGVPVDEYARNMRCIVSRIRHESPATEIYIQSILPSTNTGRSLEKEQQANDSLKKICSEEGLTYVNLWDTLYPMCQGNTKYTRDQLHPTAYGYNVWLRQIISYLPECSVAYPSDFTPSYPSMPQAAAGMMLGQYEQLPLSQGDMLFIGDEVANGAEWRDIFHSARVKNRGNGWNYAWYAIANLRTGIPYILGNGKGDKVSKIFLHAGINEVSSGMTLANFKTAYNGLISDIKARTQAPICVLSVVPCNDAAKNQSYVIPYNNALKEICAADARLTFVDCYDKLADGSTAKASCIKDNMVYAEGYLRMAQALEAEVKAADADAYVWTDAQYNEYNDRLDARTTLGDAVSAAEKWLLNTNYEIEDPSKLTGAIEAGYALLCGATATNEQMTACAETVRKAIEDAGITPRMPKESTDSDIYWYSLTDARGGKSVCSNGNGSGITGISFVENDDRLLWKLVRRADGKLNIVNKAHGTFIPTNTATGSQMKATTTEPAGGWELKNSDTEGLFIIVSGTHQFNMSNSGTTRNLLDWGGGTNTSDTGCKYTIAAVSEEHLTPGPGDIPATDATKNYYNLLPTPRRLLATEGTFALGGSVKVADETDNFMLNEFVEKAGFTKSSAATRTVIVRIVESVDGATDYEVPGYGNQAYALSIKTDAILIRAVTAEGVNNAAATLRQLAAQGDLPCMEVIDWPSFKVRGYMHDVGRDFITMEELKHEMDLLALFKINYYHWHLTENQAWRFEVKAYPQLTDAGNMTRRAGSYYTQAECRELIAYAKQRGIVVIPEIDMPGHSEAFTRAMGYTMASAQGQTALLTILEEVADVFADAPYIHIGADETSVTAAFVQKMTSKIHALGKKAMTWNPISVSVSAANGIDACQLWSREGGKVSGMVNIDSKYNYANLNDMFADVVGIFNSNCYYQSDGSREMAGGVVCVWTDRILPEQKDIIEDNNFWATMLANSERLWQGGRTGYIEQAGCALANDGDIYERFRNWEDRFLFYKGGMLKTEPIPYVRQTNVRWRVTDAIPNGGDKTKTFAPETELKDSYVIDGATYNTQIVTGASVYLRHTWPDNVPGLFTKAAGNTAYAWTYVYSPVEQDAAALIEFQNYERSWHDSAPSLNNWDKKGSRIWLNDSELAAPVWQNPGKATTFETLLTNENFTGRDPYAIHLNAGWNKVFMKLPYVNVSDIRLNRWMWTFVITTPDGAKAIDGLVYSPDKILDENAQALAAYISTVERDVKSKVGDGVGYYPVSAAEALTAIIADVRETLSQVMTAEERAAQRKRVEDAYKAFLAVGPTMPTPSTDAASYWYTLSTPLRAGKYVMCNGAGADLTGSAGSAADANKFKFVKRADNTYNIICHDGHYVSPASAHNTAIKAVATEPAAGWSLALANEAGYMMITSGSVADGCQLNQTNNSPYPIYNWYHAASATPTAFNNSDTGCKFVIAAAEEPKPIEAVTVIDPEKTYAIVNAANPSLALTLNASNAPGVQSGTGANARWLITKDGDYYSLFNTGAVREILTQIKNTGDWKAWRAFAGVPQNLFIRARVDEATAKWTFVGYLHETAGDKFMKVANSALTKGADTDDSSKWYLVPQGDATFADHSDFNRYKSSGYADPNAAGFYTDNSYYGYATQTADDFTNNGVNVAAWRVSLTDYPSGARRAADFLTDFSDFTATLSAGGKRLAAASAVPVGIGGSGCAALNLPVATVIPEGVSAWNAPDEAEDNTLTLAKIEGGTLPANCPVILRAETPGAYDFRITAGGVATSRLKGTVEAQDTPANTMLLNTTADPIGLSPCTASRIPGFTAYYTATSGFITIQWDGETSVRLTPADGAAGVMHNLGGQRVSVPRGVVIVNGQKRVRNK